MQSVIAAHPTETTDVGEKHVPREWFSTFLILC